MEDIGKIVAGFAGGVAADEGYRFLTGAKPPAWAEKLKDRYDMMVTEWEQTLSKKLVNANPRPGADGHLANYTWLFETGAPQVFGVLKAMRNVKGEHDVVVIGRTVFYKMEIYLDGELEATFPERGPKKDGYWLDTGYYQRNFPWE